jgi:RimJ/RimL family protein N-acetyltransferase
MAAVSLVPWASQHFPLLVAANSPDMTRYLGGPESDDELRARHERYLRLRQTGQAWMSAIEVDGVPVGGIGFWQVEHDGEDAYETGWNVLPAWQGRGVAGAAVREIVRAASAAPLRARLFAYPSVENTASNALCRAVGFADLGERDFPFRGIVLRTRVWALSLPHE